jgi:hypothetical protein
MACVFGEMRTLKTGSRWWSPKSVPFRKVSRNSSSKANASSVLVSARLIHCVAFNPSHFISLVHLSLCSPNRDDPCARCLSQSTTSSHCLAPTLSRSTRSHTVSPYLVLTLSHVRSRTSCHMVHGISLCQRLTPFRFIPHLIVCRATGQPSVQRTDTEPRTVRRTTERTGNIHCCGSNCCCAHTVVPTTAALYCCTIQHIAHHTDHCCTIAAPYSTPLVTPTSSAPTAAAPTTAAPTTAALAMLHRTLSVAPNKHIRLLTFLLFPKIIHSLAFLFFSPIVIIAHAISPYNNFMSTIVLCKYVLAIALVRTRIVYYLNHCVAKVNHSMFQS